MYMNLFVTTIAFVFGWIVGVTLMLMAFHFVPRRFPKRKRKKPAYKKISNIPDISDEEDDDYYDELSSMDDNVDDDAPEKEEGLLRKRLGKNRESWTQFCLGNDEEDEREHIKKSIKNGENSYKYTKNKKR